MKRGESKSRYFFSIIHTGLMLALAVLGACDGGLPLEDQETIDPITGLPLIGKNQGDLIAVRIGTNNRSVDPTAVSGLAQFYEVVFKNSTGTAYYRGEAAASQGYISVAVPVGTGYEVLLLAGRNNRTLLAAGHVGSKNIQPGIVNVITIPATGITPVWDGLATPLAGNDFTFDGTGGIAGLVAVDATNRYVRVGSPTVVPTAGDTFSVGFNLLKLGPLLDAEGGSALTLQGSKVELLPRNADEDNFTPVSFALSTITGSASITGTGPGPYAISGIASSTNLFGVTSNTALPAKHTDGLLQFALTYSAFGSATPPARGGAFTLWTIRNGINWEEDKIIAAGEADKLGGSIIVQIGSGNPLLTNVPTN
ncbi:MAG: hypothetical protein LBP88_03865 [Treponema sp.]|jgi:hypothetical protein|nr:hypothetical protein [Treponema sp.]